MRRFATGRDSAKSELSSIAAAVDGRRDLWLLASLCSCCGLYGWAVFASIFHHDGLIGPKYIGIGSDYMVYDTAARSWLAGSAGVLSDGAALTARLNKAFYPGWISEPLELRPWVYPPPFLLLLLPFSLLRFAWSFALFQAATFMVAVAGGWCWLRTAPERLLWLVALVLSPGASVNVICGQNAFLTLGLLLGGCGLRGRSRFVSGAVLGLLCYKPQFSLMVPVALLALRDWRAIAGAALVTSGVTLFSVWLFGAELWRQWLSFASGSMASEYATWVDAGRAWGVSAWATAVMLGAPRWLAQACQAAAILLSAVVVYRAFRAPARPLVAMALLLVATILAAPHALPYDLLLLDAAAVFLIVRRPDSESTRFGKWLLLLPWATPILGVPHTGSYIAPLTVVGLVLVLAWLAPGVRSTAPFRAPILPVAER
jgi:hypothetical protein